MKKLYFLLFISTTLFLSSCSKDDAAPDSKETILLETDYTQDGSKLWEGRTDEVSSSITNDTYNLIYLSNSGTYYVTFPKTLPDSYVDAALESSIRINHTTKDGSGVSAGGIVWGMSSAVPGKDYRFMINTSGQYRISGYPDGSTFTPYTDWTLHEAVKKDDYNILRILAQDKTLHFIINGIEVYSMDAPNGGLLDDFGYLAYYKSYVQSKYFKVTAFK